MGAAQQEQTFQRSADASGVRDGQSSEGSEITVFPLRLDKEAVHGLEKRMLRRRRR